MYIRCARQRDVYKSVIGKIIIFGCWKRRTLKVIFQEELFSWFRICAAIHNSTVYFTLCTMEYCGILTIWSLCVRLTIQRGMTARMQNAKWDNFPTSTTLRTFSKAVLRKPWTNRDFSTKRNVAYVHLGVNHSFYWHHSQIPTAIWWNSDMHVLWFPSN